MDYTITWGGDPEDVCLATRGVVRVADLNAMIEEAVADPRWTEGMRVLIDHTQADWSHLLVGDIEERAEFVKRMAGKIGKQRVAWASRTTQDLVSGRYVGYLLDWNVPFVAHGFTSLSEAREWLRQPPDEPNQPTPHVQPRR